MQSSHSASDFSYMPSPKNRSDSSQRALPLPSNAVTDGCHWTSYEPMPQFPPIHCILSYPLSGNRSDRIRDNTSQIPSSLRSSGQSCQLSPGLRQIIPEKRPVCRSFLWNRAASSLKGHNPNPPDPDRTPASTESLFFLRSLAVPAENG